MPVSQIPGREVNSRRAFELSDEWPIYVTWRTKGIPQLHHLVEINVLLITHSSSQVPASQFLHARLENEASVRI